ncbi:hypothetical protein MASR1M65_04230 [Saprospiraceae bacterium]
MEGPDEAGGFWIAAVVASALVGAGKGGIAIVGMLGGTGSGAGDSAARRRGCSCRSMCVSDMFGLWAYRQDYDARVLAIPLPGALAGIGVGWATASIVPEGGGAGADRGDRAGLRAEPADAPRP